MFKNIDKNTVLGVLLIALMVGLYTWNQFHKPKPQFSEPQKAVQDTTNKAQNAQNAPTEFVKNPDSADIDTAQSVAVATAPAQQFKLENNLVKININSLGAQIEDVQLKTYTTSHNAPVALLPKGETKWNYTFPTQGGNIATQNLSFSVVENTANTLKLRAANGVEVSYTLAPNEYYLSQNWTIPNLNPKMQSTLDVQTQMPEQENNLKRERQYSSVMYLPLNQGNVEKLNPAKNEEKQIDAPFQFMSLTQQFFNVSIVPNKPFANGKASSYYMDEETGYVKKYKASMTLAPSDSIHYEYFIGPSSYKILKKDPHHLKAIIPLSQDFVLFRWVKIFNEYMIIPIFDFLSGFISNYGIIILILTLFIKMLLMPLSYKTYKSGVATKILKPELDKLKAKYGDDQQGYAQAQMKLMNEAGANPLGGCLPMLLQMPILFAMFSFFPAAIELRHEPFLWANDLSTYDSIMTLPFTIPIYGNHVSLFALLMTITQIGTSVYMQRLQPSSPQADQMKMMTYLMPIVFLFMFNSFPAALTYYYLLQNIISVLQQWFMTKFVISESRVRAEIEENKKKPKKQGGFSQKMQELMEQAEQQKKQNQNPKK